MNTPSKGSQDTGVMRRSSSVDPTIHPSVDSWLEALRDDGPARLRELLSAPWDQQLASGYGHTLREICQQPLTWVETAAHLASRAAALDDFVGDAGSVVLSGSGSSLYAAECVAPCLQRALRVPATAVPAGLILTHPSLCLPPTGPYLAVSLARSGNSPESRGAVDWLLEHEPRARHLILTCNRDGALATSYGSRPGTLSIVLDENTHDKSLVMTSSFTNLVLAARGLGAARRRGDGAERVARLARAAGTVLRDHPDAIADLASAAFPSAVYLGSGCRLGSAREAALKMLEMTAGQVWTLPESYLGLRHGPMSALRKDTLVVAFLSSDPVVRAYEMDLLCELREKELGSRRLIVGARVPAELVPSPGDVVVDCDTANGLADEDLTVIDALAGQLLAFFRCRGAGYRPDSPSEGGVITRVVSDFVIHRRNGEA
jgi:D-galactosamine 6-phosphate deaminase/isomerase